jgi:secondary thiamine-phosphate synthase enzyme
MTVIYKTFEVQSEGLHPTFHDATKNGKEIIKDSGITNGILLVYSGHTTCSVMTQESSHDKNFFGLEFLQQDLCNIMERLIPTCRTEGQYLHPGPEHIKFSLSIPGEEEKFCLNTDGHLRSVFFGRSVTLPVVEGKMQLGQFGYVYFVDWDQVRGRKRKVQVMFMGE